SQHNFQLNSQDNALYVPAGIWHEIRFTQQAVLLVVSSTLYSDAERQADYIEDFDDFLDLKLAH
ncbi:MAG: WxcM-like domain-containing protein, partial [Calditrichaeota bacterium]|nr:WxcM-like domain-containing protein [Calditrichota bacterium]